jgi:hypothetical protein
MHTLFGRRVLVSALLSGLVNALLIIGSISSANGDADTFIQKLIRIIGFPAGFLVRVTGAEGHDVIQAVLLMVFSFVFYLALIWAVLTAAQRWRRASESRLQL